MSGSPSTRAQRCLAALCGLLGVTLLPGCGTRTPVDWVATIESLRGSVGVAEPGGALTSATVRLQLRVGTRLETGVASEAVLKLRNGGQLTIRERSVVQFKSDLPERKLNLALQRGQVVGKGSQVEAAELVIGVGGRSVRLGAAAQATVTAKGDDESKVVMELGSATVEGPSGTQTVVEGKELVLSSVARPRTRPDAAAPRPARPDARVKPDAATTVVAPEVVFYLQASGPGRVLIRRPGEKGFVAVRKGEPLAIKPGTEVKLVGKARVLVGPEKGSGTALTGPTQVMVHEGSPATDGGRATVRLENTGGDMQLNTVGAPGKSGAPLTVEGVKITTRITYRRLDVKVKKERNRTLLVVGAGEATLVGKDRTVKVEAGQEVVLAKGKIAGPNMPPAAALEVKQGGTLRVFSSGRGVPVTLRWNPEGKAGTLVEVSRSPSFAAPIFSDVIQRRQLNLSQVALGTLFWQVRPLEGGVPGKATQGKLILVKDTSHRVLTDRKPPKNTIHESFGNTTVFYQNLLPRFTFRWEEMPSAATYQVKVFREQSLSKPLFTGDTKSTSFALPVGKLGEGTYLWYVAGRDAAGALVRTTKSSKILIRYDNATPDLQIVYPANGAFVTGDSLEARGVAIPGSKVFINGAAATLDDTFRFTQVVKLRAGVNHITFLVVDPRRGSSYYLRQVTRR